MAQPCAAQLPCSYQITDIILAPSSPGWSSPTRANAISPNGRYVVGSYNPGGIGFDRGYWYDTQTKQLNPLPFLPGTFISYATDVSDAGLIVGEIGGTAGDWGFVFNIATQQYTLLPPIDPLGACRATGINSSGQVSGWRSIGSKVDPVNPTTAFVWTAKSGFNDLGVMNGPNSHAIGITEDGTVFGYTGHGEITSGTRGFVWHGGSLTVFPAMPGATSSAVRAVLDAEHLVLSGRTTVNSATRTRAFSHIQGTITNLGVLPGLIHTFAWAIDDQGQILGGCSQSNGNLHALAWRNGQLIAFNDLIFNPIAYVGEIHDAAGSAILADGSDAQGNVIGIVLTALENRTGDTNCDRVVNVTDLLRVIGAWGPCAGCSCDLDGDLDVDAFDLIEVVYNWG